MIGAVRKVVGNRLVWLARVLRDERQWWRDARAARREYVTLGCRSNADLDRLPLE